MGALLGQAILGVWQDIDPAIEADYDAWYLHEHIPERLAVPGMRRGRRYRATEGSPRYAAFHEAATLEVLTSGAYRTQLANPTAWTRRVMSGVRLMQRGLCTVIGDVGQGIGGAATFLHMRPQPDAEAFLHNWIVGSLLPELITLPDVAAVHAWSLAPGEPASPTTALTAGGAVNRPLHWVVAIETSDVAAADAARDAAVRHDATAHGAAEVIAYPSYALLFALTA